MIKFLSFEIEYSNPCIYDSLEISEELYSKSPYHGKYCGNNVSEHIKYQKMFKKIFNILFLLLLQIPPTIVSYSEAIHIRFQSDETTSLRGFAVAFVAVEPPEDEISDSMTPTVTPFPGYMKSVYDTY